MSHHDQRDPRRDPWLTAEAGPPAGADFDETAAFLLGCAVLAPSGHNTQPWRFAVREPDILVYPDPGRRLPVADPDDRELTMSLGAAVMNLRVAAAAAGLGAAVSAGTGRGDDHAARVTVTRSGGADEQLAALFPAVARRRTWRLPMDHRPLAPDVAGALGGVTALGSASLAVVTDAERRRALEDLIHEGDLTRMSDKAFRKELAHWMRPAGTHAADGLAGDSLGLSAFASDLAAWSTRAFDMGKSVAAKDVELARGSAALVVVTADDVPGSLLDAGQLAERFILTATLRGAACSFFNLPVEAPALRQRIGGLLASQRPPQLLFRVGYPTGDLQLKPSPRRPLAECLAS